MEDAAEELANFRSPGGPNGRLAHWEPREPSLRWFKSYLQIAAESLTDKELEWLSKLGSISLGAPVTVTVQVPGSLASSPHLEVNLDYVLAAEEFGFLDQVLIASDLTAPRHVAELGAGFGRTAHALLATYSSIESYLIVDLPETLALSRAYLSSVLPVELWNKVKLATPDSFEHELPIEEYQLDLLMQIDGFQEMLPETIDFYYASLVSKADLVFLSNPIGKYRPETAGIDDVDEEFLAQIVKLGRCHAVIDPWSSKDLSDARDAYLAAYLPEGFQISATSSSRLRPFYQHVVYRSAR